MNSLEIDGVSKTFKSGKRTVRAVDGVTLAFGDSGIFGLLGMNGAGKSTLIKICTGLIAPDGGSVKIYGYDVVHEREQAKALVNISPQETAVAPLLSVRENLEFIASVYGADKGAAKSAADEMMDKLGLSDRAKDRAGKLSGGLMRRLSVGMALITRPKLVFLDEPTLGLDVVSRRELWKYIREIKETTAVVLTTHYLEEAEALCDRIAIMARGVITAEGTAEELKEQSGEATFENAFLRLAGEAELVEGACR